MAKVFVSYSRKDTDFTKRLTEELQKSGLEFWVDWEGIPPTVDFMKKIENGIEESDVFLFLLSPDSAKSKVCGDELAHAVKNSKRLIPLVVRDVKADEVPQSLSHLNWIFFRKQDDFEASFKKLLVGINTDFDWVEAHRRLLVRALEWQSKNKDKSFLLRGNDLHDAESQLAINTSKDPHPTDLHREYILKSRQAADRQRRWTTILVAVAAVIMFALAVYGLNAARTARKEADRANASEQREATAKKLALLKETEAKINQLSALAISKIDQSFNEALLLGVEAFLHARDNKINDLNTQGAISKILQSNPGLIQILQGHTDWVNTMALSPDGSILASGSWDQTVILWDISNPSLPVKLKTLEEYTGPVKSVTFSANGKMLAASSDSELILWDVADPSAPELLSQTEGYYASLEFSQDGGTLISLKISQDTSNIAVLFNVSNPKSPVELIQLDSGDENLDISEAVFIPKRNLLFCSLSNGDILEWDTADAGNPQLLFTMEGNGNWVNSMTISPDGNTLAVGDTGTIISLWDVTDPAAPSWLSAWSGHSLSINSLAFSADGSTLASSSNEANAQIILWDISNKYTPRKIRAINGHALGVNSLLFDIKNDFLVSGSRDGTIMLWNSTESKTELELGAIADDGAYDDFAFQPNSNTLVSIDSEGNLASWDISDLSNPKKVKTREGPASVVIFTNDGSLMASMNYDETATLWNTADFSKLGAIRMSGGQITAIGFNADGKILAINGEKIVFWDVSDPKKPAQLVILPQENNEMDDMAFSSDGKLMASISGKKIVLWDVSGRANPGRLNVLEGHTGQILTVAFSPANAGLLASAGEDKTVILWDVTDPKNPQKVNTLGNHSDWINSIAFTPDGTMLASASDDKQVNLWNVSNPEAPVLISKMIGHANQARHVEFSPSGSFLVSLDYYDGDIIFWDINPESWAQKACTITGGDLTDVQWNQYFPTEEYRQTCEAYNVSPGETALVPVPTDGQPSSLLPACTGSQTPGCSQPTFNTTDAFCVDTNSYGLYTLSANTTFEVLTPGFACISEEANSRGEPRISCTGPVDMEFQVSFCNSACSNALETSNQCQAGFGLNAAEGCCAPISSASNGCVTETLILAACDE